MLQVEERRDHLRWVLPCHSPAGEENFQGNISSFFVSLAKGETQSFYPSLSRSILEVVVVVFCLLVCLFVWVGGLEFCCFVLFCFGKLVLQDRVSLWSPGCVGTYLVDQASLELKDIHLPLPLLSAGMKGIWCHQHCICFSFFKSHVAQSGLKFAM